MKQARKRTSGKTEEEGFAHRPFAGLRSIMEQKGLVPRTTSEPIQQEPTNDEELFADAMRKVREIRAFRELPVTKGVQRPETARHGSQSELRVLREIVEGKRPIHLPDTPEYVEWRSQRSRCDITALLHRGELAVQDCLDLHGMTLPDAEEAVREFIGASFRSGLRCVKIIHGRGLRSPKGPVLKEALVRWLSAQHRRHVTAFASARACDGGLGAVYVLLRDR